MQERKKVEQYATPWGCCLTTTKALLDMKVARDNHNDDTISDISFEINENNKGFLSFQQEMIEC